MRAGQPVEERALAGVGVAHQGHSRNRNGLAPLALLTANALHRVEIDLQLVDAPLNLAPIGFELRFAGPARADAAAKLRHGFASAGEARQHVFELRQLHLQLALARSGMAGKDVEDELRAVEHAAWQRSLQVAQLRRAQVVIEEHQVGIASMRRRRRSPPPCLGR